MRWMRVAQPIDPHRYFGDADRLARNGDFQLADARYERLQDRAVLALRVKHALHLCTDEFQGDFSHESHKGVSDIIAQR